MNHRWQSLIITLTYLLLFFLVYSPNTQGQNTESEATEVYLEFRYRGVINTLVIAYYKNDEFYLPISELFNTFQIDNTTEGLTVTGKFSTKQTPYTIALGSQQITYGGKTYPITKDDYIIGDLDNYIRSDLFDKIFNLNFSVNFNNLTLGLETQESIPIVERIFREQRRKVADGNRYADEKYELKYDRQSPFLDLGFVDYNLSSNTVASGTVLNYNTNIGAQFNGGDIQGALYGSYSDNFSNFGTNNLRWRYMFRNNSAITRLIIGQTQTDGLFGNAYTGIKLSNDPIEPRRNFDEFAILGTTIPQSEVELYLNNLLIDFVEADAGGNYQFLAPISYGANQINLKIFGPTGQIIERSNQIQIPFNFQPVGVFNYKLNAGQLDVPLMGSTNKDRTIQGKGSYGFTNWLSGGLGVEYYESYHKDMPTITGNLSSRFFSKYILTFEAASKAYYRSTLSATFPNFASFNLDVTEFESVSRFSIYNSSNDQRRIVGSLFYPFQIFSVPFNVRLSSFSRIRNNLSSTSYSIDTNTRLNNMSVRFGYKDRSDGKLDLLSFSNVAILENSLTYNLPNGNRSRIPGFLKGAFIRSQLRYQPSQNQFESAEFLISQKILQKGRLQLAFGKNFARNFNTFRFSFVFDFNKIRSSSTFSNIQNNNSFTQNIRGSVGYDSNYENFIFTSRDQVGRAGAAVKLFVDNNNNGTFDEGDDSISENAIRLKRSGATSVTKNGILYYTQMQPYFFYNMELNKGVLKNPMLVPDFEKFGLITDPNRFKKIEIPFYMSGVVEGSVKRLFASGLRNGIGGLKLNLVSQSRDFSQEIRTFSDGSFYAYEVPPGKYTLSVDNSQLDILNVKSQPGTLNFEVKALPEGDFIEGLNLLLVPKDYEAPSSEDDSVSITTLVAEIENSPEFKEYETTLQANVDETLRLIILAQTAFYQRNLNQALEYVNNSLNIYETAQGYALKGSLHYLKGNKAEAQKNWAKATRFNPDIYIPEIDALDQIIKTELGD